MVVVEPPRSIRRVSRYKKSNELGSNLSRRGEEALELAQLQFELDSFDLFDSVA